MSWSDLAPDNPANPFSHWLRRLWPVYCLLAALATFGYALYDPYQIDGDAVAYLDISDLIRAHSWHGVINGYWNPLYPAFLAFGHNVFHATRYTELHACYMVNFSIFLLQMLAIVAFTDALIQLRDLREKIATTTSLQFLLDRYTLRYLGIGLIVISAQRELSMGKIRPDALLQALLLFALAALLRHLATSHLRYAALMGLTLGLAYLTKSFAFLFAFLCIIVLVAFRLFWQRSAPVRIAASALLALVCFSIIAGPYIAALSKQKGRFDFGDSANLNYAWFISGTGRMHLQPNDLSQFGAAEVHLNHPEQQLLQTPAIFSYKQLPYGTYPDWFDPSFWNDEIKTHMNPRLEITAISQCFLRLLRYLSNNPEPWLLLFVLLLLGARLPIDRRRSTNGFWLAPALLGATIICIYGAVHIEDRYIAVGVIALLLSLFAALRVAPSHQTALTRTAASAAVLLLALLAVGQSARSVGEFRRHLINAHSPAGWYNPDIFGAAHALNELGVGPGDAVACIGARACLNDHYWARLAGVRILAEIYEPSTPLYPALAAMPNRDHAIDITRLEGARVLVGYFDPALMIQPSPVTAGWRELDDSPFFFFPLNLPAPTSLPPR